MALPIFVDTDKKYSDRNLSQVELCYRSMKHKFWITFSGSLWAFAGVMLLRKGLHLLNELADKQQATWLIAAALLVGFVKGRFVLAKTVVRITNHIASLPLPISFWTVYPKSYWLLLSSMMVIGFALRLVPIEWRGFIDVAIGSALINGAMLYFRAARSFVVSRT